MHSGPFWDGLVTLEFPQGEETGIPWFGRSIGCLSPGAPRATPWNLPSWLLGWPLGNLNKFLPADPPPGRLPSISVTWGACYKSSLSLILPLDQGEEGKQSGKEAARTWRCLKRWTPQSNTVSLSTIHSWNSS